MQGESGEERSFSKMALALDLTAGPIPSSPGTGGVIFKSLPVFEKPISTPPNEWYFKERSDVNVALMQLLFTLQATRKVALARQAQLEANAANKENPSEIPALPTEYPNLHYNQLLNDKQIRIRLLQNHACTGNLVRTRLEQTMALVSLLNGFFQVDSQALDVLSVILSRFFGRFAHFIHVFLDEPDLSNKLDAASGTVSSNVRAIDAIRALHYSRLVSLPFLRFFYQDRVLLYGKSLHDVLNALQTSLGVPKFPMPHALERCLKSYTGRSLDGADPFQRGINPRGPAPANVREEEERLRSQERNIAPAAASSHDMIIGSK